MFSCFFVVVVGFVDGGVEKGHSRASPLQNETLLVCA